MEKLPDLKQLSNEAKEALIVELWEKIQKLSAILATYEPKPEPEPSPKKTSKNSSTPPSSWFKPNIKPSKIEGSKRQRSVGRAGGGRELHPHPDQIIIAQVKNCLSVWRKSHRRRTKIAIRLRKNRTTTNSSHYHPNWTLWWSVCLLSNQVCCACAIVHGTRFTIWQFNSKPSYISPLHSCHQLRTAVVHIGICLWTQNIRRSNRKPVVQGKNQFRWPSNSNTPSVAAGKINLFRWNQCQSKWTKSVGVGVSEPGRLFARPEPEPSQWSNVRSSRRASSRYLGVRFI